MQYQGESTGPKPLGQVPGCLGNMDRYLLHIRRVGQKQGQRHLQGSVFHLVHPAYRSLYECMCPQSIQRIGGKGYQSSLLKNGYRRLPLVFSGLNALRATHGFP